jgi:hypothetical protein
VIEILHSKKGAKIIKLNTAVKNLNAQGNLVCHCGKEENTEKNHLTG